MNLKRCNKYYIQFDYLVKIKDMTNFVQYKKVKCIFALDFYIKKTDL